VVLLMTDAGQRRFRDEYPLTNGTRGDAKDTAGGETAAPPRQLEGPTACATKTVLRHSWSTP
jgi:hypothetical protein